MELVHGGRGLIYSTVFTVVSVVQWISVCVCVCVCVCVWGGGGGGGRGLIYSTVFTVVSVVQWISVCGGGGGVVSFTVQCLQ